MRMLMMRQHNPLKNILVNYFLYIVDQAISSIESKFEQFQIYENIFGFLFNFEKLLSVEAIVTGIVSNTLKAIHAFGKDSSLFI